jgi:anti-sigma factor RsiW
VTCDEARLLLHAYEDGELDLAQSLEVDAHARTCAACAREQASLRALRTALGRGNLYYDAPAQLERRLTAAVRDARRAEGRGGFARNYFGWAGAAAAALLLVAIMVRGVLPPRPSTGEITTREVVDDHLRSLTQNHLADVLSSNQHTVKPWFDGKLDFTPPVEDLAAQGFPLVGGRLDYLDNRPVAALVYQRRQHIINIFIAPAQHANDTPPETRVQAGYNIVDWTKSGMRYWAVSSLNAGELGKLAQLLGADSRIK